MKFAPIDSCKLQLKIEFMLQRDNTSSQIICTSATLTIVYYLRTGYRTLWVSHLHGVPSHVLQVLLRQQRLLPAAPSFVVWLRHPPEELSHNKTQLYLFSEQNRWLVEQK